MNAQSRRDKPRKERLIRLLSQAFSAILGKISVFAGFCRQSERERGDRYGDGARAGGKKCVPSPSPRSCPPAGAQPGLRPSRAHALALVPELAADDPLYAAAVAANQFIRAAKAPATLRAYAADWRHFTAWCAEHGLSALPATPDTVALYLADLARPETPAEPVDAAAEHGGAGPDRSQTRARSEARPQAAEGRRPSPAG